MALQLYRLRQSEWGMSMSVDNHPFVERIRAERAIISAVNGCRPVVGAELAGTSEKRSPTGSTEFRFM